MKKARLPEQTSLFSEVAGRLRLHGLEWLIFGCYLTAVIAIDRAPVAGPVVPAWDKVPSLLTV